MANQRNYQRELDALLQTLGRDETKPVKRLLLHSCCAPCSSYCLAYLSDYFEITDLYYNPNISPKDEYEKRVIEQKRLIEAMPTKYPVHFLEGAYEPEKFYELAKGLEHEPEGGKRCERCFELRLREAAKIAREGGYDYFTTTLSISPLKNAKLLNEIGEAIAKEYGLSHLPSDFKKKEGYKHSVELSKEYDLYRQNYCGCIFSKRQSEQEKQKNEK